MGRGASGKRRSHQIYLQNLLRDGHDSGSKRLKVLLTRISHLPLPCPRDDYTSPSHSIKSLPLSAFTKYIENSPTYHTHPIPQNGEELDTSTTFPKGLETLVDSWVSTIVEPIKGTYEMDAINHKIKSLQMVGPQLPPKLGGASREEMEFLIEEYFKMAEDYTQDDLRFRVASGVVFELQVAYHARDYERNIEDGVSPEGFYVPQKERSNPIYPKKI